MTLSMEDRIILSQAPLFGPETKQVFDPLELGEAEYDRTDYPRRFVARPRLGINRIAEHRPAAQNHPLTLFPPNTHYDSQQYETMIDTNSHLKRWY